MQEAENTYSKAAKAELSADYDIAFRLYIKAAELYLHESRTPALHDKIKQKCKIQASKALERAEKIKAFAKRSKTGIGGDADAKVVLTPVGVDHFSPQEQSYVLEKGSFVNGLRVPLWDSPVQHATERPAPFIDPDGEPSLSSTQTQISPTWIRRPNASDSDVTLLPQDIIQHIVSDCSVCASISVCLEHCRRFGSKLATSILHPSEVEPGRYDLKLLFNGQWRRIVIDDRLPYDPKEGKLVCMSCSPKGTDVLWPSLLEKGYMKLMGGYDFPGSNSSIDLHTLVGWIPEHIDIGSSSFERETTWQRLYDGFTHGRCMVTLGTGPYIPRGDIQLLPSHSYAVINVSESEQGERTFTILDSWVSPEAEHGVDVDNRSRTLRLSSPDVLDIFSGIYLSWDPQLWEKSLTFHGMWKVDGKSHGCTRRLRLSFKNRSVDAGQGEIWILLTRHVVETRRTSDFMSLKVDQEEVLHDSTMKIPSVSSISSTGTYTNSTHMMTRARLPVLQSSGSLSILASFDGTSSDVGFTITAYASGMDLAWIPDATKPPFTVHVEGTITSKNAGGHAHFPSFMVNPQYHLHIHPPKTAGSTTRVKADVAMTMETGKDLPVNIAVLWSQGERVFELFRKEVAANSGAYTYGLARVQEQIPVGDYTVVLSAFEPRHTGPFSFKVESSLPCDVRPIAQEGSGMYCKTIRGRWLGESAAGGPSFHRYADNPIYKLQLSTATQLKVRLQLVKPSNSPSLNLTIFPSGSMDRHIATSGGYDDTVSGVVTPQVSLKPGDYWLLPSTYHPGVEADFQLIVYSSSSGVFVSEIHDERRNEVEAFF